MKKELSGKNWLKPYENDAWTRWVPREELAPVFEQEITGDTIYLRIESNGNFNSYGKWICSTDNFPKDRELTFQVDYLAEQVGFESVSIYAVLTWKDNQGNLLARDYVDERIQLEDGWKRLQRTIVPPDKSDCMTIELAFRWTEQGRVIWRNPSVFETNTLKSKRIVRVATTSILSRHNPEENVQAMLHYLDEAGRAGADIVCFTETFNSVWTDLEPEEVCQPIPGDLTRALGAKAKEYNCYVVFSMYERDGMDIFNTAVLLDRNGNIAGKYYKVHLPLAEAEQGVTPGREYKVFDTDFGRIGIIICWDQAFPDASRAVAEMGAEIIFIPTIGHEPIQAIARAKDNGVYVVVSGMYGPESSMVIDPMGKVIATVRTQNPDAKEGVCVVDIDLAERHFTHWLSMGPCLCEPKHIYTNERRLDTYSYR